MLSHPDVRRWLLLPVLLWASAGVAQQSESTSIHWAYSNYFGTGWYRIGDDRDAFVLRYVYRKQLQEASYDAGKRRLGVELRVPVTAGLNHFPLDDLAGTIDFRNLANVSVTPGVYVDVPVNDRWMLRPFGSLGYGRVVGGHGEAWTWWGGIGSRYRLSEGDTRWTLVNSISYVGYTPAAGRTERFWPWTTALELTHGLRPLDDGEDVLQLNWHAAFTHYHDDLSLTGPGGELEAVSEQWEIGVAVSRRERPVRLLWFDFERIGLAYRFNSSQDLQGVALVFRSLFDR